MSYLNLKIDRRKIVSTVYEKCVKEKYENYVIGSLENKDGKRYRLPIEVNGKQFFIDFFFNNTYLTTIQTGQGNNVDLQEEFAKHIFEDKSIYDDDYVKINKEYELQLGNSKKANDTIVYKRLEDDIFDKLQAILHNEKCCARLEVVREDSTVRIVKIYDSLNNEVTLTNFPVENNHTIMLQGKPKVLFAICAAEMAGLITKEENINALNIFYGTQTTLEEIEKEYDEMFVNSKRYINEKLKRCICQALQNRRDLQEKFDPTYLAAPAERALEGHIRYALAGIITGININVFEPIKNVKGDVIEYKLQRKHWAFLGNNQNKIDCIGKAYTYMRFVRNKLSHWDNPNPLGDTTRLLASNEVDKTIMDALKLIEEYYA